jgi:hypothetical protein
MLRLYAATHREIEDSLLPECAQVKEEAKPNSSHRKEIATLTTVEASVRGRRRKNIDSLPVYQKPRPLVRNNFFAPLMAVPMVGAEVCDETPYSDNNLEKEDHPPPP